MAPFRLIKCKQRSAGRVWGRVSKSYQAQEESLLVFLAPSCLDADVMAGAEAAILEHAEDKHWKKMSKR